MTQPSALNQPVENQGFEFTGNGGEYFRIWIVNLLLTIVTLGIYSAWAKVRTNRYMYGNTKVAGDHFEYLAEPMQILRGRLIAVGVFIVYVVVSSIVPLMEAVFMLLLFIAVPWIITRSLAFRARMTSYRNIRFRFSGSATDAAIEFILMPILMVLTLGLLIPYVRYRQVRFVTTNHSYGTSPFSFSAEPKQFYGIYLVALGLLVVAGALIGFISDGNLLASVMMTGDGQDGTKGAGAILALSILLFYFGMGLLGTWIKATETNLIMGNLVTGNAKLVSNLKTLPLFWLYLSNLFLTAITLGLFFPWAIIRLHRYRAQCTALKTRGDMNQFVAASQSENSATGEELGEVFDVDFAL